MPALSGADVAGGVLPGYDVGGDFFDYAANADGLWLVVADATGKGNSAAALSSLAIGALRAARRGGAGLQEAARLADEAIVSLDMELYLTAVPAPVLGPQRVSASLDQLRSSHPVDRARNGRVDELDGERTYPLGMRFGERMFPLLSAVVGPGGSPIAVHRWGQRRRRGDGGASASMACGHPHRARSRSAATTVRGLQDAVINASPDPLRDDATLLVIAPHE